MRVLDLFSGIGGFSLGLERAGMKTVAFCEIEDYPSRVLAKHWPKVPIYHDIRKLTAETLRRDGITVDVICSGFPCQDIARGGKGAGITGEKSGLWTEYARLIDELRPRFVIVENSTFLRSRGIDRVLGDLAEVGYDAEWHCIPASYVGAPHKRDRIWIVSYPHASHADRRSGIVQMGWVRIEKEIEDNGYSPGVQWRAKPGMGIVAHGVSDRLGKLCALGNAVVPQIPEIIGRAIMAA